MATSNTIPVVIPQPIAAQATSENINVIPNGATGTNGASFQEGFPAITRMPVIENPLPTQKSGLPPKQQDFNGLFNVVSQHNFFSQNGGTYSFNQAVSDAIGGYPKNSVLWYFPENEDPFLVYSLINNNTNNFVEDPTLIDDEHWKKLSFGGSGEIGDIGFAPLGIDESENKRRYLNGQVIIQSQFVSFTNKVKAAIALYPSLSATEENWQAEKTNSKLGQCGKFVVDDTAGTIRLPAVVNAQGLVDLALLGVIKAESLPNIKFNNVMVGQNSGMVSEGTGYYGSTQSPTVILDASRSSSTYQDNAPVQQEAVQYPYYIVVNTGVEEAERPINNYQVNNVYSYGMSQYYKGVMNNNSWLRSQGQWNDGAVYTGMYNWLLEQMNAGVSGFVASTAAYTDYDFVINTTDQTFRLPLLDGSEDLPSDRYEILTYTSDKTYVAPANGWFSCYGLSTDASPSKISYNLLINTTNGERNTKYSAISNNRIDVSLEVSRGQSVYTLSQSLTIEDFRFIYAQGNGSLYYYVGDTLQNADLINVARIEEKITDLSARRYVTETWKSGTSWYRIWSDGWIEQGGVLTNRAENVTTFNLLIPYNNTNFTGTAGVCTAAAMNNGYPSSIYGINSLAPVSGSQACTRTVDWSDTSWSAWGYRS